MHGARYVEKM